MSCIINERIIRPPQDGEWKTVNSQLDSKVLERMFWKRFGKDISYLQFGGNKFSNKIPISHFLTNTVVIKFNMFCSCVKNTGLIVICNALRLSLKSCGVLDIDNPIS